MLEVQFFALTGLYVANKLHLLLGGDGKSADFQELATLINQPIFIAIVLGKMVKNLPHYQCKVNYLIRWNRQ